MKRRVWVPVKSLALVEIETDETDKRTIFDLAVEKAFVSHIASLPQDDVILDDDEIENAPESLISEWVELGV